MALSVERPLTPRSDTENLHVHHIGKERRQGERLFPYTTTRLFPVSDDTGWLRFGLATPNALGRSRPLRGNLRPFYSV